MRASDLITRQLEAIRERFAGLMDGEVATYIPELASANPDQFGIAVASRTGGVYTAGDVDTPFTIQSVSKPFVYAMALTELGLDTVLKRVGSEPSGEAFNAISLDPVTGIPANPMINAGAIVTTSLIDATNPAERFERILTVLSDFAGRSLSVDEAVYQSERETGDKNRALAFLMRNAASLTGDVDDALDAYFRQCSVLATARDVAVMAATLANGGVNPVTGRAVVDDAVASQVLSIMATCGMYDASGEWLLRVGLPAKSGVSGVVLAASPGQLGLGLFSPRLDTRGNSVRAIAACRELSERFDLHLLRQPNRPEPALDPHVTEHPGTAVRTLHGDISFADAEGLLRSIDDLLRNDRSDRPEGIVIDLTAVRSACRAASMLLAALGYGLAEASVPAVVAGDAVTIPSMQTVPSLDAALRWLDDRPRSRH